MKLSHIIESQVKQSPFISECLNAGLINTTALARYLQPSVEKEMGESVQISAIAMAIKRMPMSLDLINHKSLARFIKQLRDILVRSELENLSVRHSPTLFDKLLSIIGTFKDEDRHFFGMIKGIYETTLVFSNELSVFVHEQLMGEEIISSRKELCAVSIMLPKQNLDTSGVYYTILKKLAWKGINIVEVISTSNEVSLLFDKKDIDEAFKELITLSR